MLVDEAYIIVKAGKGGDGAVSFFPGRKSGPDGGNGGNGGNVYIRAVQEMHDLYKYAQKKLYQAEHGKRGEGFRRFGKDADDLELPLPIGTTLIDQDTREVIELTEYDQRVLICKGGKGGRGNDSFKTSINRAPKHAESGEPGEEKNFKLILKLIADFGLIGLPNAGKSSLLNELTAANVKTANYPFTTLEPNLGVVNEKVIADIPGLIEGASSGKGLGIKFLKHIEKVKLLLHCVAADSATMEMDYNTVINELKNYNPALAEKEEIILLTKIDLVSKEEIEKKKKILEKYNKQVLAISIYDADSLETLKKILH